MLRQSSRYFPRSTSLFTSLISRRAQISYTTATQSSKTVETTESLAYTAPLNDVGTANPQDLSQQAPNRIATWSASQIPRAEVYEKYSRFNGKDLSKQPKPYSAMELISKEPIRYLEGGENIAVCDGNKGLQGHPRIYINLDQAKLNTCGYCGLRFAKLEFKELIEGSSA